MLNPEILARFHARFPFLSEGDLADDRFEQLALPVKLEAGDPICLEGNDCTHLAFVLEGGARVYKMGETGREITLYRVSRGECCILTLSCILTERPFPAFATAETPLQGVLVPAHLITNWNEGSPAWRRFSWELVSTRLADIISLVEEITFRRMDERLAHLLKDQRRFPPGQHVKITHREIATELGTSREVVSRLLKEMEQQGEVTLGRGWLRVG